MTMSSLTFLSKEVFKTEQLALAIKPLDAEESAEIFKKDISKWGYQAVQVTIENHTENSYLFSPESIGLPLVNVDKIAREVLIEALPRSIGFKILSFLFWPFIVPSTLDSLIALKQQNKGYKTLHSKVVKPEIIPSYSTFYRVFFVEEGGYQGAFSITLQDQETLIERVFPVEANPESQWVAPLPLVLENYYLTHG